MAEQYTRIVTLTLLAGYRVWPASRFPATSPGLPRVPAAVWQPQLAAHLLRPRVAQLERMRALVPDNLLGLAADEAFIGQQEEIWRVCW